MNIDKRLKSIINEIDGNVLVDVGCDHGKVTYEAIKQHKVNKVIATDISNKSLKKCIDLIHKAKFENVDFRCGDGLEVIKDNEADVVCISGMGGYEIIKILSKDVKGIEKLVLCPHHDVQAVREFLQKNWKIEKDFVIYCEDHCYSLIVAKKGHDTLTEKELLLGKDSLDNEDYIKLLEALKTKYEKIMSLDIPTERAQECQRCLDIIEGEINGSKKDI